MQRLLRIETSAALVARRSEALTVTGVQYRAVPEYVEGLIEADSIDRMPILEEEPAEDEPES